ncbi:MAG: DNA polymerase III subunit delta [Phycisphaeraceae bacterium]
MARRPSSSNPGLDASTRICVLTGPEEMLKRQHLQELRQSLEKEHGEVETFTFDGKSAELAEVLDELRSYSLMQTYKLVLVDEADQFVKTHRQALERYAESPVDHATLVFRSATWNKGKLDKLIARHGGIVKCTPPAPGQAKTWLTKRSQSQYQRQLQPAAADALIDRLGPDLMKLDSELSKLSLMVEPDQPIGPDLVREVVGKSSEEQAWAVQEAVLAGLARGSAGPVISKLHELVELADQPDVLVAYFVADLVRKFNVALMMKQAGVPEGVIARQLKLWGDRQQMFFAALRKMNPERAAAMFRDIVHADRKAKSGLGEPMRNLEGFCVRMVSR